jgi:pyruvate formate lyase activating enzyme
MMATTGAIFDIQRFSIHDGPGIRTTVFLKGCSLRCFWCHNPEGMNLRPQIQFYPGRCIACGECVAVCPQGAQELTGKSRVYHREECIVCGQCVAHCDADGLLLVGREVTAEEVLVEVLRDRTFYETSGGGATLSGGDPLMQPAFSHAVLAECKDAGLHTAIETCAHAPWDVLASLIPVTDLFMVDLKHMDPERHRTATGSTNQRILENARRLSESGKPILFRIPVVPTVNDTTADIADIARFVAGLAAHGEGEICLELLPFHRMAADKYRSLGLEYRASELVAPSKEHMSKLWDAARAAGAPLKSRPG